jgi:DNA-binding transcriptional ArsR family regulator
MDTPHEPRLARVAAVVADPARSRMLAYLLSGEYASASELAKAASVTPATASGHLSKLLDARFVVCEPRGRHRYYRLADDEVAHALEALALVAERDGHDRAWAHPERKRLRLARCCYGHLAGQLAVLVFDALQREDRLTPTSSGYELTDAGRRWLQGLGMTPVCPVDGVGSRTAVWTGPNAAITWRANWPMRCTSTSPRWDGCAALRAERWSSRSAAEGNFCLA